MKRPIQERVEAMYSRDRLWALVLLACLWIAVGVVYFGIRDVVTHTGISIALIISAVLIVGYNTASVIAMIRHYSQDKSSIYDIDIRHLDQMRAQRARDDGMPRETPKSLASD